MTGIYVCNGNEIMAGKWATGFNAEKALESMKQKEKDLGFSVKINGDKFTVKTVKDIDENTFEIDMTRIN